MQSTLSAAARRSHRSRRAATRGRVSAHARTCTSQAAKITYLHNAASQRVFKSEPQTAQTNASIGTAYSFADQSLPSWALLGEYDNGSASGAGRVEYIWLPQEDGNAIPVAMFRGSRYWNIHSDHLGTPRLIKDDAAKPTWQWAYSAFGDNKPTGILKATTNPNAAITNQPTLLQATGAMEFNLRFPGQYLDQETGQFYNYYRTYMPNQGRYTQNDPIGLAAGFNRFAYVNGNPLMAIDPMGLTQADIDAALNAAKSMMPTWKFPSSVKTWSQSGKGGKSNIWSKDVYVDAKYLECLDDGEASALLNTLLHELAHFNQRPDQFAMDNIRERITGGASSAAQDTADSLLWKNHAFVTQYLKNRHVGKNTCECRK